MEYVINIIKDREAGVWVAINDYIPLSLEDKSFDELIEKVKKAVPELIELNNLPHL